MKNHLLVFVFSIFTLVSSAQLMRSEVYDFSVGNYYGVERRSNVPSMNIISPITSGYFMYHILTKQVSVTGDSVTYSAQRQTYIPPLPNGMGGGTPSSYSMDTIVFLHDQLNVPFEPEIWDHVFGNSATLFWDRDTNECYYPLDTLIPSPWCFSNSGQANHFGMHFGTPDSCQIEPYVSDYYAYSNAGGPYGGKQRLNDPTEFIIYFDLFYVVHNGVECGQFPSFFLNTKESEPLQMSVYPNPTSNQLTVSGIQGIQQCTVIASDGKLVTSNIGWSNNTIDVSSLNAGIYYLQITDIQGKSGVAKFVK
jgi:hypothetical protein